MDTIRVTEDHLALLAWTQFDYEEDCEWGGIAQDYKRPFGNSDVIGDMGEIVGRELCEDEARLLHIELTAVVQQAVRHALDPEVPFGLGVECRLPWRAERLLK